MKVQASDLEWFCVSVDGKIKFVTPSESEACLYAKRWAQVTEGTKEVKAATYDYAARKAIQSL